MSQLRLAVCLLLSASAPSAQFSIVSGEAKISETQGGFTGGLSSNDGFGSDATSLGDLDGDGRLELATGAPGDDDGGSGSGAVWILDLNPDGSVASQIKISGTQGGFTGGLDAGDGFGSALETPGDLDGDGNVDLAVGAPGDGDDGQAKGAVWVLFLASDGSVGGQARISDGQGGFTGPLDNNDNFGSAVASLGDLDGDGIGDLMIGACGDDDGGSKRGAVWVLFLNADGSVRAQQKISSTQGGFTGVLENDDRFGCSAEGIGDLDGDGIPDAAVGAVRDDDGGNHDGAVWVLFLNADGTVKAHQKISDTQGGFTGGLDNVDEFGSSLARVDDLNNDGVTELAVGAVGDDDGGSGQGAVWVLFLNADGTVQSFSKISATAGGFSGVLSNGDQLGSGLAFLGDLNGDGAVDLAAGARGNSDNPQASGTGEGALWNVFWQPPTQATELGSGTNPIGLVDGVTPPALGLTWNPTVFDFSTGDGEPLLVFLGVSREPSAVFNPQLGDGTSIPGVTGELLISIDPADLIYCLPGDPDVPFSIPIPGDPKYLGLDLYAQGGKVEVFGIFLANGLNIQVGL